MYIQLKLIYILMYITHLIAHTAALVAKDEGMASGT